MKKTITILLALIMALSLVACGGTVTPEPTPEPTLELTPEPTPEDNSIEITIENYQKYFDVSYGCGLDRDSKTYVTKTHKGSDGNTIGTLYAKANLYLNVTGVSPNFNYDDIVFVVKVTGKAECYSGNNPLKSEGNLDFEKECKVECNIAGKGENTVNFSLPRLTYLLHDLNYEIVSVSGKITPA